MIKLTNAQMGSLSECIHARNHARLARCVVDLFPEAAAQLGHGAIAGSALDDWLRKALALGQRYGIDEPADQAVFLALAAATVEIAPTRPGFLGFSRPVLERSTTPGPVKLAWIEQRLATLAEDDTVAAKMLEQVRAARTQFQ